MGFNISPLPTAPALENIGGLTITDGVVTGFAANKYLQSNYVLDFSKQNYEISSTFICTNVNWNNTIFRTDSSRGGIAAFINNNGRIDIYIVPEGQSSAQQFYYDVPLQNNTKYQLVFRRKNGVYSVLLNGKLLGNLNFSLNINSTTAGIMFGGGNPNQSGQYMQGSYYLEGTCILEDNKLVAGQMIDREPTKIIVSKGTTPTTTGPIAINTVGTLTINDGVVTGFNATSNYLQAAQKFDFTKANYEIACKFKSTSSSNTSFIFSQGGITLCLGSGTDANKVEAYMTLETSGYAEYKQLFTTTLNNIWSLIFRRTGGTRYDLFVADSSGIRKLIKTWTTTENIRSGDSSNILRFGGGNTYNQYLTGNIYLKGTYATVDNELWAGQFDDGYMLTDANYLILNDKLVWANSSIYLQSDGNQYIDTNILPTSTTEMEVSMRSSTSSTTEISCGSRVAAYNSAFIIYSRYQEGNYWFALGNYTGNPYSVSGTPAQKHTLKLSATNTSCSVDGEIKTTSLPSFSGNNYKIYLYKFNNGGNPASGAGSIYSAKIWQNGTLVRHFVPVPSGMTIGTYTTPSAGMFDMVTQTFYANSGSGTFTWGKDN